VTLLYRAPEVLLWDDAYTPAIDVWAAGAVMLELARGAPVWPGTCEVDQLFRVFQDLATPSAATWPGVYASCPDFAPGAFPCAWRPRPWARVAPELADEPAALDLLARLLALDPTARVTAAAAVGHSYFSC
jgi:serine/threonine protein kinase